ncbi:nucleotide exchange factor GrpE [Flavobacterium sp.]|uniref:nucleotide exchange factor GrpE n=1 Tax=Flavobacterium sp. TaxID=239 RepID=UPI003B9A1858
MKFKNPFKSEGKMSTEQTEINKPEEEIIAENAAAAETTDNASDVPTEPEVELSAEEKLTAELAAEKDKFIRLFAEFENYKRRTAKERIDLFKTANQDVLVALLPILDDFDRAVAEISKAENVDEALFKGVSLIHDKFKSTLQSKGLEQVDVKAGDLFDADFAEAITQIPAPEPHLKGKVVDVIEKGYKLGDKIIRYPKVVTGN